MHVIDLSDCARTLGDRTLTRATGCRYPTDHRVREINFPINFRAKIGGYVIGGIHWYPQPEPGQCWAAIGPRGKLLTVRRAPRVDEAKTGEYDCWFECWIGGLVVGRDRTPCRGMETLAKAAKARGRREALV